MCPVPRIVLALAVWIAASPAAAQTSTATLSADIRPIAKLTLSTSSVSFADADPDLVGQVPALGGPITITGKTRATSGEQVVLTVVASDDLRSGVQVINASAITWTTTGAGFVPGMLSATSPAMVAQWTGSGTYSGTQQLFFRNLWSYPTGTYTTSLLYTLTAP